MNETECQQGLCLLVSSFTNPVSPTDRMILVTFFCIIGLASIIGNCWTLATLHKNRVYHTLYKCCLFSLALSDLVLGVFVSLENSIKLATPDIGWRLGDELCSILPLLTTTCMLASSLTLALVAADRYHGLAWLQEHFKPNLIVSLAILYVLWAISTGASVNMYFLYKPTTFCIINSTISTCDRHAVLCLSDLDESVAYFSAIYAVIFIPLVLLFLLSYGMIAWRVWGARRQFIAHSSPSPLSNSTTVTETATASEYGTTPSQKTIHSKKKQRTFRVVLVIMATFLVSRLPQWTFNLVTIVYPVQMSVSMLYLVKHCVSILTVFNTAINPFLYSFLDSVLDFNWKLFRCFRV